MIAALRLARVGVHLGYGLATVALIYPCIGRPLRLRLKRRWSRQLLAMLGVRLLAEASLPPGPCLLVANHVSWLDVFVINALEPAAFVCKAEVRHWPLLGWLCERTETLFLMRGNRRAARHASETIAARLRQGWTVAVFPEGTTSDGTGVLPFHGALFEGAIAAGRPIQPLALRYCDAMGRPSPAPAYCGQTTLMRSLFRVAAAAPLQARVVALPPLQTQGGARRHLAVAARQAILGAVLREDGRHSAAAPPPAAHGIRAVAAA